MKNILFVAFSHGKLNDDQIADFEATFGPTDVVYLADLDGNGPALQDHLKNVSPHATKEALQDVASDVLYRAKTVGATHVYIQSAPDFNVFVNATAADMGMVPVVVTTERNVIEKGDQKIVKFQHVAWREIF